VYFEGTNLSEGRGTARPFQVVGAGWLRDAGAIARALNAKGILGVVFDSTMVTVEAGQKWGGERIPMITVDVTDRNAVVPVRVGLEMLRAIYARHPDEFEWRQAHMDRLAGSERFRRAVEREGGIEELLPILAAEAARFRDAARASHLYR